MMYFKASKIYNSSNWNYIEIPDEILVSRYDWVDINLPNEKERVISSQERYPWAHTTNIKRLFLLCRTFLSKSQAIEWMNNHLKSVILPIHLSLIEIFCYAESNIAESIDELINKSEDEDLLAFIQIVLDRSRLWYDPNPCYPSEFEDILWDASESVSIEMKHPLKWIDNSKVKGVDRPSPEAYTHVYFKYQNLISGIAKGELYYDIKQLSKQALLTLLESMSLFFEHSYKLTFFNEENWERKFNEIAKKETEWCKVQIQTIKMKS